MSLIRWTYTALENLIRIKKGSSRSCSISILIVFIILFKIYESNLTHLLTTKREKFIHKKNKKIQPELSIVKFFHFENNFSRKIQIKDIILFNIALYVVVNLLSIGINFPISIWIYSENIHFQIFKWKYPSWSNKIATEER